MKHLSSDLFPTAFGTLVDIGDRRGAYLPLLRALPPDTRSDLKHRLMREDRAITDELASIQLRPGMVDILVQVRAMPVADLEAAMRPM